MGHLYIGGAGLSPGYWRDNEATRAAFLPDPRRAGGGRIDRTGDLARASPDGLVYFLGREDSQIKSRGHRVELGEIESALAGVPELAEFAVVGMPSDGFEGTAICCAYSAPPGVRLTPAAVKQRLRVLLPRYMLPTRWMEVDSLPKNANGKVDRARIRNLFDDADHV